MRTKASVRHRKQERIQKQASVRIRGTLSGDHRRILALSREGYSSGEMARELALDPDYVMHFMTGLIHRLAGERIIGSPDWRNVLIWAAAEGIV